MSEQKGRLEERIYIFYKREDEDKLNRIKNNIRTRLSSIPKINILTLDIEKDFLMARMYNITESLTVVRLDKNNNLIGVYPNLYKK